MHLKGSWEIEIDFLLFHVDNSFGTAEDQQKCIELYENALGIMDSLGMADHKECILSLTNLGICHQLQGNQEQAMILYQRALHIAERELRENHTWKVYLKTQMAYWNKENGKLVEAKTLKDDAVRMSYTLGLPDNQPRNKFLLQKIWHWVNTRLCNNLDISKRSVPFTKEQGLILMLV